jgi:conjugative transfer region lipoprotein (TIGR03751 family)
MKTTLSFQLLIILLVSTALTGCMTPGKNIIPQGGDMTMAEIYKQETGLDSSDMEVAQSSQTLETQTSQTDDSINTQARNALIGELPQTHYDGSVEEGLQSINQLYKPLPNPEIGMYVYPHLIMSDGESFVKPGITTAFFMFKDNAIAMPGEIY